MPLSALVIGSLSPDFAYFVPYELGATSHSLIGIFTICWPTGLAAWLIFEHLLRAPTVALMPAELRRPRRATPQHGVILFMAVSAALVLGAATHIIWDAFTHAGSPLVAAYPQLRSVMFAVNGYPVRVYKFLQHASTAIGLIAIGIWIPVQWRRAHDAAYRSRTEFHPARILPRAWRVGAFATVFVVALAGAILDYLRHPGGSVERQLFYVAIGGMTGCALAWCIVSIAVRRILLHSAGTSSGKF